MLRAIHDLCTLANIGACLRPVRKANPTTTRHVAATGDLQVHDDPDGTW